MSSSWAPLSEVGIIGSYWDNGTESGKYYCLGFRALSP